VLAGRTFTESRLRELLRQAGFPEPPTGPAEADQDDAPFEIDFSRIRPIIFEARDQTVRLGVRGTRFGQGGRELKRPMEITAVYVPAADDAGRLVLARQGEVNVDFPGQARLTLAQAGLRGTIKKKFADVFPDVLLQKPVVVPETARIDTLRGRVFRPSMIAAQDGWLSIGIR
jgi:hypothetical protein